MSGFDNSITKPEKVNKNEWDTVKFTSGISVTRVFQFPDSTARLPSVYVQRGSGAHLPGLFRTLDPSSCRQDIIGGLRFSLVLCSCRSAQYGAIQVPKPRDLLLSTRYPLPLPSPRLQLFKEGGNDGSPVISSGRVCGDFSHLSNEPRLSFFRYQVKKQVWYFRRVFFFFHDSEWTRETVSQTAHRKRKFPFVKFTTLSRDSEKGDNRLFLAHGSRRPKYFPSEEA